MSRNRTLLWQLLFLLLTVGPLASARSAPPINGRIDHIESIRVLRVWGTPQEMGFAHGFLLADDIAAYVNESGSTFFAGDPKKYSHAVAEAAKAFEFPSDARAELVGILDGIKAAKGVLPQLTFVGRPLQLDDLILTNAMDAMRAFGCSGFTVWGEAAGPAGLITGRNFDFGLVSRKGMVGQILVRLPTGRHAVASVAPPGYIGSFTGINDAGVCVFMHDGDGQRLSSPAGRYAPLALTLTGLLESTDAAGALTLAEKQLKAITPYPFSYMVRIVAPRAAGDKLPPARVYRVDANGLSENRVEGAICLTTNHYLPASNANGSGSSATRYRKLTDLVTSPVSDESAWKALRAVADDQRENVTLHSVVVYPQARRLEIAFATIEDKLVPAPNNPPIAITFDRLFAK